jgi:hypothetical protein
LLPAALLVSGCFGGGTWAFAELNDVTGRRCEDNHPLVGTPAGFDLPVGEDCVNGDQAIA